MSDNHAIATKLEEYLDADYFAGAIKMSTHSSTTSPSLKGR